MPFGADDPVKGDILARSSFDWWLKVAIVTLQRVTLAPNTVSGRVEDYSALGRV